jgi:hypothetical protein
VNDYSTTSLQVTTFPTLFPYGCGDVTNKERSMTVSMTQSNGHLLNYAYCRYLLIKYRPWQGPISDAWGENDATEKHHDSMEWHAFLAALASNGIPPPDFLDREMNTYLALQRKKLEQ